MTTLRPLKTCLSNLKEVYPEFVKNCKSTIKYLKSFVEEVCDGI